MHDIINILVSFQYVDEILAILSNQEDFIIAGLEKDASGIIIKSERLRPDVLIMDFHLPGISGPELAPVIHRRSPATSIILICSKYDDSYASLAFSAGISGLLIKEADLDKLIPVIRIVFSGGYYFSSSIIVKFFNTAPLFPEQKHQPFYSPTERGIVTYIALGFSDDEISKQLNISINTVKNYVKVIKHKTKLKNRIQIVIFSLLHRLINIEQLDIIKNYKHLTDDSSGLF